MKLWRCKKCRRKSETKNEIVMKICNVCQIEMELNEVEYETKQKRNYI